jgi:hypothetical protein
MTETTLTSADYVARVLAWYLGLRDTPLRASRLDRRLAAQWHTQGIPLSEVEAATVLAAARRSLRPADAPPLGPIRSLHYFAPVLAEVRTTPLSADYLAYLRGKLAARATAEPSA